MSTSANTVFWWFWSQIHLSLLNLENSGRRYWIQRFVLLRQLTIEKLLKCDNHPLKGPQLTDRGYLNDTKNAGYYHSMKTFECRIGPFHKSDLGRASQSNARIPHVSNSHDLSTKGPQFKLSVKSTMNEMFHKYKFVNLVVAILYIKILICIRFPKKSGDKNSKV